MSWRLIFFGHNIMSAFGSGSLANYSANPLVEGYAKKVITHNGANAQLLISSRDRFGGTNQAPLTQPYNKFVIQKGFPVQQGQIMSVKVSEIMFPYEIPNINEYNNLMSLAVGGVNQTIIVPTGFYTGTSLASTINGITALLFPGHSPTLVFNSDGTFTWTAASALVADNISLWPLYSIGQDPLNAYLTQPVTSASLLSVMGFNFAYQDYTVGSQYQFSGQAPMVYTQYIDIKSNVLTQYQDVTDVTTATPNLAHIICRLYIANEVSTVGVDASGNPVYPGMNPFVIHRQFKNPKVMKWNNQNSVDRVDIELYDDQGRLLRLPQNNTGYTDFQITFQSSE